MAGGLRRRDGETLQFLRYSFASNGELKAGYYAAESRKYLDATEATDLIALNESNSKMLRRRMATLNTSEKNDRSRRDTNRTKDPGRTKDY